MPRAPSGWTNTCRSDNGRAASSISCHVPLTDVREYLSSVPLVCHSRQDADKFVDPLVAANMPDKVNPGNSGSVHRKRAEMSVHAIATRFFQIHHGQASHSPPALLVQKVIFVASLAGRNQLMRLSTNCQTGQRVACSALFVDLDVSECTVFCRIHIQIQYASKKTCHTLPIPN